MPRSLPENAFLFFSQRVSAQGVALGRDPSCPEEAQDVSPGRSPGVGRSVPFLPMLKPRRGVSEPPMSQPHVMGDILDQWVSPLWGLCVHFDGRPDSRLRPGLWCFAPLGRPPPRKPSHRCRKDTAFCRSGFSHDPASHLYPLFAEDLPQRLSQTSPLRASGTVFNGTGRRTSGPLDSIRHSSRVPWPKRSWGPRCVRRFRRSCPPV